MTRRSRDERYAEEVAALAQDPRAMARRLAQNSLRIRGQRRGLVLLALAVPLLSWIVVEINDQAKARSAQEQVDLDYRNCLRGNEIRMVLIEGEKEPNTPTDLSVLPSVRNSPAWFQDVVAELKALSERQAAAPIDPQSRTGRRIARYQGQIRDCELEYPGRTPGIRLIHPTITTTSIKATVFQP